MSDSAGRARGRAYGRARRTREEVRRPKTAPKRGGAGAAPEAKSPVAFCLIKDKLKQQDWKQRLQQAQILKQCIASMQNLGLSNAVPQTSLGNYNSTSQPSAVAQPDSSLHPSQSGINMKPCDGPPVGALLAAQQVPTAARQTAAHMIAASVSYEKEVKCSVPVCLIVKDQFNQQQLQQRLQYAKQRVQRHTLIALQQFIQTVKLPRTPQTHKNALAILKSNPELFAIFIKVKSKRLQLRQQTSQPSPVAHPDLSLHVSQSGIDMKPCNTPSVGL